MLVVGAKGFAKNVLEILFKNNYNREIVFFDNVSKDLDDKLYGQYKILKNFKQAEELLTIDPDYTLGVGNPVLRKMFFEKFNSLGGKITSAVSEKALIGNFNVEIDVGVNISFGVIVNNDVYIGKGGLININATIGHDCYIGEFTEICPNVSISGYCKIGNNVFIGSNATIAPQVTIGDNSVVGAGSVVLHDIPPNSKAFGSPAKVVSLIK